MQIDPVVPEATDAEAVVEPRTWETPDFEVIDASDAESMYGTGTGSGIMGADDAGGLSS